MRPFLKQEDRTSRAGTALRDECDVRRVDEAGILRSIDESSEVAVVVVRPARGLFGHLRHRVQRRDRLPGHVEDDVVSAAGDPQHGVVLGGRHPIVARSHDVMIEILDPTW